MGKKAAAAAAAAASKKKKGGFMDYLPYIVGTVAFIAVASLFNKSEPVTVITELTDATFDSFIKANPDGVLVDFFTPGCPHCVKLAPDFESAAKTIRAKGGAPFATMDAKEHPATAKKLDIDRYPTVIWFRHGERVLELPPSSRAPEKIVEYVEWAGQPALVEFATEAEFEDALPELRMALPATSPPMVVGFGGQDRAHAVIELMAERFRGKNVFMFVKEASSSGALLRAFGADKDADKEYRGDFKQDALEEWVKANAKAAKAKEAKEEEF